MLKENIHIFGLILKLGDLFCVHKNIILLPENMIQYLFKKSGGGKRPISLPWKLCVSNT